LTGCVDEDGAGHYVLLDDRMQKIVNLKAAAPDDRMFARFMGHEVRVKGTHPSGQVACFGRALAEPGRGAPFSYIALGLL
jgi:hypothetical protein